MKPIVRPAALMIALFCSFLFAAAQNNTKPQLFGNFPKSIPVSVDKLEKPFQVAEGQYVSITLSSGFIFSGKVISNVRKYKNLHTVMISSPSFDNSIFQISRQTNKDNSFSYVGRILNDRKADGYKLAQENDGKYYLTKFDASDILPFCGH